jgi:hypothetical protein
MCELKYKETTSVEGDYDYGDPLFHLKASTSMNLNEYERMCDSKARITCQRGSAKQCCMGDGRFQ